MRRPGFTLIEALIGLALSLFIITAGLGFYAAAQKTFVGLQEREEAGQAALAAIDKMRIDLLHAGLGLASEIAPRVVEAAEVTAPGELRTASVEKALVLAAEARAGDTRLSLVSTADLTVGRRILLSHDGVGEVRTVTRVEAGGVQVEAPLEGFYASESSSVSLLEFIAYYRDGAARILRRRVNASSAQPVLEGVASAAWSLDPTAPIVRLRLELDAKGVPPHEATVFLKNLALAWRSGT